MASVGWWAAAWTARPCAVLLLAVLLGAVLLVALLCAVRWAALQAVLCAAALCAVLRGLHVAVERVVQPQGEEERLPVPVARPSGARRAPPQNQAVLT